MMRKIVFLHLSLLLCMVYACSPPFESKKESEKQSVISEARAYFETNASDLLPLTFPDRRLSTKTSSFSSTELTPLWDKAYETNHNGVQFVEVPLSSTTQLICVETVKRVAGADPEKRISCQRLLVIANTSLGKEMYVATLVPSEAYLAQTKNWTVEPRTEKGELLDFSGRVFYSTLKGRITKVAKFENGRLLGNDIRLSETFGFGIYTEKNDLNLILSKIHFVEDVNKTTNMLRETSFLESLDETYKYLSKNGGVVMPGLGAKYIGDGYEDEYEFQLGNQVLMQMRHDLISEQFSVLKATEYGIEDGLSYTLNMTNIGASCIAALDNADALMIKNFGNSLTFLGAGMSVVGTFVAFTDGDISGIDVLGAVEAALNVISTISILWPTVIAGPIGFYAGITACVVGTFCAILSDSMMIQVPLKNGKNVYVYIPATIN